MVLLLFQHTYLPISAWMQFIYHWECFSRMQSSLQRSSSISTLWLNRSWSVGIFMYQSMSAFLHLGKSTTSGSLWVECFQPSLVTQVSYVFPSSILVPIVLSRFLAEQIIGQVRLLILVAHWLMETLWLPLVFNMLEDIPYWFFITEILLRMYKLAECPVPCSLAAQWHVLQRWGLFSSVCQTVAEATQAKVCQQCWKVWTGWCTQEGVQTMLYLPLN